MSGAFDDFCRCGGSCTSQNRCCGKIVVVADVLVYFIVDMGAVKTVAVVGCGVVTFVVVAVLVIVFNVHEESKQIL